MKQNKLMSFVFEMLRRHFRLWLLEMQNSHLSKFVEWSSLCAVCIQNNCSHSSLFATNSNHNDCVLYLHRIRRTFRDPRLSVSSGTLAHIHSTFTLTFTFHFIWKVSTKNECSYSRCRRRIHFACITIWGKIGWFPLVCFECDEMNENCWSDLF